MALSIHFDQVAKSSGKPDNPINIRLPPTIFFDQLNARLNTRCAKGCFFRDGTIGFIKPSNQKPTLFGSLKRPIHQSVSRLVRLIHKTGDQTRAYVFVDKAKFYWGNLGKTNPHVVLSVKNSGQSPAKWISVYSRITVTRIPVKGISHRISPLDSREKDWTPDWKEISRWSALGTGSNITVSGDSLTTDEKTALKNSLCELAIDGTVRYETIFGEITESEFSFIIRKPGDYKHEPLPPLTQDVPAGLARHGDSTEIPHDMKIANARLRIFDIIEKPQTKET